MIKTQLQSRLLKTININTRIRLNLIYMYDIRNYFRLTIGIRMNNDDSIYIYIQLTYSINRCQSHITSTSCHIQPTTYLLQATTAIHQYYRTN